MCGFGAERFCFFRFTGAGEAATRLREEEEEEEEEEVVLRDMANGRWIVALGEQGFRGGLRRASKYLTISLLLRWSLEVELQLSNSAGGCDRLAGSE